MREAELEEIVSSLGIRNAQLEGTIAKLELEIKRMVSVPSPKEAWERFKAGKPKLDLQWFEKLEVVGLMADGTFQFSTDDKFVRDFVTDNFKSEILDGIRLYYSVKDIDVRVPEATILPAPEDESTASPLSVESSSEDARPPEPPTDKAKVKQGIIPGFEPLADARRKRSPLQNWIVGATLYAEAVEMAAGLPPEAAKRIIEWGRDQKLLKPLFDQLGASELTRRWTVFVHDADKFLARNRTFQFFASNVNNYSRPLRRPVVDPNRPMMERQKGEFRSLPMLSSQRATIDKAMALMERRDNQQ